MSNPTTQQIRLRWVTAAAPMSCDGCVFFTDQVHPLGEPPRKTCFLVGDSSGLGFAVAQLEIQQGTDCMAGNFIYQLEDS